MSIRLMLIPLACCLVCIYMYHSELSIFLSTIAHHFNQLTTGDQLMKPKIIIFYTSWNVEEYWGDLNPEKLTNHLRNVHCSIKNCELSYDKNKLSTASGVLFHAQDMSSDEMYSPRSLLYLNRPHHQRWIWVNQESPVNLRNSQLYDGFFNWTATYHRKSEILLPYGQYRNLTTHVAKNNRNVFKLKDFMAKKKGLVAWVVSDCGGIREKYVLKLQQYLNITVFGNCGHRFKNHGLCIRETKECSMILSKYKFYLAFENSICEDYITEKYWKNSLMHEIVPVVFGANYDAIVAIPNSFINVRHFESILEIANFLIYLDRNDEEYIKYLSWQQSYEVLPTNDLLCTVCEMLHDDTLPVNVYKNLGEFWSIKKHCEPYHFIKKKIKKQIENAESINH